MPGMDGLQTLRQIKALHPLVEVILLTGHATVPTAVEGMRLGAFDYLMKPCDIADLTAKIRKASDQMREHIERILSAEPTGLSIDQRTPAGQGGQKGRAARARMMLSCRG